MTFTRDNIVGVEFIHKHTKTNCRVEAIAIDGNPIISWHNGFSRVYNGSHSLEAVLKLLNNGTWIVKNSKV